MGVRGAEVIGPSEKMAYFLSVRLMKAAALPASC